MKTIYTENDSVTITFTGPEAHYVRMTVRHELLKRQKEIERSTYVPPPGKGHASARKVAELTTALEKIRQALKEVDKAKNGT